MEERLWQCPHRVWTYPSHHRRSCAHVWIQQITTGPLHGCRHLDSAGFLTTGTAASGWLIGKCIACKTDTNATRGGLIVYHGRLSTMYIAGPRFACVLIAITLLLRYRRRKTKKTTTHATNTRTHYIYTYSHKAQLFKVERHALRLTNKYEETPKNIELIAATSLYYCTTTPLNVYNTLHKTATALYFLFNPCSLLSYGAIPCELLSYTCSSTDCWRLKRCHDQFVYNRSKRYTQIEASVIVCTFSQQYVSKCCCQVN